MIKKNWIVCLSLLLIICFSSKVFANDSLSEAELIVEMNNQIEVEKSNAKLILEEELKKQDALEHLQVFEEYIYKNIEERVKHEYAEKYNFIFDKARASQKSYYAPNGGTVAYLAPVSNYKPTEMSVVAMNRSDSYDYFLNRYSYTPKDLIIDILGFLPGVYGGTFSMVSTVEGVLTKTEISRVRDAGGYAEVISSYSREFGTSASITWGWNDRPYIYIPSNSYNVSFNRK